MNRLLVILFFLVCSLQAQAGTWYWKGNASGGGWSSTVRWFSDSACTSSTTAPLNNVTGTISMGDAPNNLYPPVMGLQFGYSTDNVTLTGTCSISGILVYSGVLTGGTWTGDNLNIDSSDDGDGNSGYGQVSNATLTGTNLFSKGFINLGTKVQGIGFHNSGNIQSCTISGLNFVNNPGGVVNGCSITTPWFNQGTVQNCTLYTPLANGAISSAFTNCTFYQSGNLRINGTLSKTYNCVITGTIPQTGGGNQLIKFYNDQIITGLQ